MEPRRYCTEERSMRLYRPSGLASSVNGLCECSMAAVASRIVADQEGDYRGLSTGAAADLWSCLKAKLKNWWMSAPLISPTGKTATLLMTKRRCLLKLTKVCLLQTSSDLSQFLNFFLTFERTDKGSLLSRLFRRRSPSKKRTVVSSFSAQFPPPEWLDASKVLHLHSVAVQTQSAETSSSTPGSVVEVLHMKWRLIEWLRSYVITFYFLLVFLTAEKQCQVRVFDLALVLVANADTSLAPASRDALADAVDSFRIVQPVPQPGDSSSQHQIGFGQWPHTRFPGYINLVRIGSLVFASVGQLLPAPSGYTSWVSPLCLLKLLAQPTYHQLIFRFRQSKSAVSNAKYRFVVLVFGWTKCQRHLPLTCAQFALQNHHFQPGPAIPA